MASRWDSFESWALRESSPEACLRYTAGDYFLSAHDETNPTCLPFEPLRCHCFITKSTFGQR